MTTPTDTIDLPPQYRAADVEAGIARKWDAAKAWHAEPADGVRRPVASHPSAPEPVTRRPFSIVIPPPNVTAALHMGHALNNTLQDVLTRYHRMLGDNAMWMPGTDHAGIATQAVVDRRLQLEGKKSLKEYKLDEAAGRPGREEFIAKVQAWKDEYEGTILGQLKAMGCSCDWDRTRFTMDDVCARAVREAFFQLFKDGLIYRGKRLVNWDPVTQTALSNDEVEMEEIDGQFYYLRYPLADERGEATSETVIVATTRPETMLGDTAVAVNPKDPHRSHLVGRKVRLPIVNRVVPIIADEYVVIPDPAAGENGDAKAKYASGFLKVTPAHDPNDWTLGQKHGLAVINVMAPDATISLDHGWPSQDAAQSDAFLRDSLVGLSREEARKAVVRWFKEHDLFEDAKPYRHAVGHSYRSHVPIEPYLSDQWYIDVKKSPARPPLPPGEGGPQGRVRAAAASPRDHHAATSDPASPQPSPAPGWAGSHTVPGTDIPADSLVGLALRALAPEQRSAFGDAVAPQGAAYDGEGAMRFTPARYAKTYEQRLIEAPDWCISRQLWWGHRIPVWSYRLSDAFQRITAALGSDPTFDLMSAEVPKADLRAFELQSKYNDGIRAVAPDPFEVPNLTGLDHIAEFRALLRAKGAPEQLADNATITLREPYLHICLRRDDAEAIGDLEDAGFVQDPDVLDTWFSSGLWPFSTMGWPDATPELSTWNPTDVLCTAREIIVLWVARMVMFNAYFLNRLPYRDVFIHAMIQDGHGQKMSKSLGNGVDPIDIIHSHGSDAMRFTLCSMTTHTQDVRMPVELVDPYTPDGEAFEPKFITVQGGYKVAAPVQERSGRKIASSYGVASGKVKPSPDVPVARNTSEKFDYGRNFANKLWNAVRFSLANLSAPTGAAAAPAEPQLPTLSDRWILSRLARTVQTTDTALAEFRFADYAQNLYDFFWRDLCDWYIEAVKPSIASSPAQRAVLAASIDASLRLLHPVMPFITERLWEALNAAVPGSRSISGVALRPGEMLMTAAWPEVAATLIDEDAEAAFTRLQDVVSAIRNVRTTYKVPPRQTVDLSAQASAATAQLLLDHRLLIETLAACKGRDIGPQVARPKDAAVALISDVELYIHGLIDPATERQRLSKRTEELEKQITGLRARLGNESYIAKAPPNLVQETRDQLVAAERESQSVRAQLAEL